MLNIETLVYGIPGLLVAFVFHELGHGYTAYALGDPTPRVMGRLSLNPMRHIDPVGFIMIWAFGFGWAKPVQVDPRNFANPRRDMALVAFAGPFMNFVLAFLALATIHATGVESGLFYRLLAVAAQYNVGLGVFNMLPIPPLDGSKVLAALLPPDMAFRLETGENWGWLVLILLVATGLVGRILWPLAEAVFRVLNGLAFFFHRVPGPGASGNLF